MKKYIILSYIFLLLLSGGCKKSGESGASDPSNLLFNKSESLIRLYIDSVKNATDSLKLYEIISHFDNKMTNLNYEFPPDTDLMMSEEENDSLIKLYKKWEKVKARQDSIVMKRLPSDSVSIQKLDTIID